MGIFNICFNKINSRRDYEEEGGDNWPYLQLELGMTADRDNISYADINKEKLKIKLEEIEFGEENI